MSHLKFSILAFSTNFCLNKFDLSGNTFLDYFGIFSIFANRASISPKNFFLRGMGKIGEFPKKVLGNGENLGKILKMNLRIFFNLEPLFF